MTRVSRIWSLTTDKTALSAHLVLEAGHNQQEVLQEATRAIRWDTCMLGHVTHVTRDNTPISRRGYQLYEMTLQVEQFQSDMERCGQCRD